MTELVDKKDDPYGGFNDYDHAYDLENAYNDREFLQAVARSSHGRRPATSQRSLAPPTAGGLTAGNALGRMPTAIGTGLRSSIGTRRGEIARPMTAVRAAGYTSGGRKSTFENIQPANVDKKGDLAKQKMLKLESRTFELLKESIFAYEQKNYKLALEKAKEAGRKEREATKQREQFKLGDTYADMTFAVYNNLAQQYMANGMLNDALNTYHLIVKDPIYANAGRLKVNIGNIHFRKKDYLRALKHYRMALDRIPQFQTRLRCKVQNNVGVALIRLGRYEDALQHFEECMDTSGDYPVALNLVLCAYCLDDNDKMREAFQRLVDIPLMIDDEMKYSQETDVLTAQILKNDSLTQWERQRKQLAERTILTAAKIISPRIASTFSDGYSWCVEAIKQSVYSSLAIELEINKASDLLKRGDIDTATEALIAFNNKDSKIGSAAANNLSLINYYKGKSKYQEATQFADQALSLDRYNSNALVNRGNIYYQNGDVRSAQQCYKEALQIESSCIQALYNLGIVSKEQGDYEQALQIFYKLQQMLKDDPQIICQLAAIYEAIEDTAQSIELYLNVDDDFDPSISSKLARVYDAEGDKANAFTHFYRSYGMFPANIEVIEWIGAYYLDTQFPDKAVNYFEKAALLEPDNIKWQLLMASCQRRSGNFQKALELYRQIHRKFPTNVECLKFLVQLCHDLRMPEEKEYARKLKKLEDTHRLRVQRETDSSQGKRRTTNSAQSLSVSSPFGGRPESRAGSSRASIRTSQSARQLLEGPDEYQASKRELNSADLSYKDPVGPLPSRPKTGTRRDTNTAEEYFDDVDILEDDLLPEGSSNY